MPKARGLPPDVKPADPPGTLRVSAREMRDAAARAGGFDHLTIGDVQAVVNRKDGDDITAPKRSKYRNVRYEVDGVKFQSKKEARYWHELVLREKSGEIHDLQRQVPFDLKAPVEETREDGMYCAVVVSQYIADYVYHDAIGRHVVDAKGKRTQEYALKRKWLELQSQVVIEEV